MPTVTQRRSPHALLTLVLIALVATAVSPAPPLADGVAPAPSPLAAASTGGVEVLDRALAKLAVHRRLLVVGAHPDDEDTAALATVARGMGGEAAYLSLSRGEGGQNLIGPELGVGLGLLRSRELAAAREIDGARQYFTRAYDFGYTRSLDETLERWPAEELALDVARVVRRFRPQVIVSVFPPDAGAGHGQHQAAGVMAREAFERAGSAGAFPELAAEDLLPWQPLALYRATWRDPEAATLVVPTGVLDPLTGHSLFQLAIASRSMHRSQDMGRVAPLGSFAGRYALEGDRRSGPAAGGDEDGFFAGIDTRLEAIAELIAPGAPRAAVAASLGRARELAEIARRRLSPAAPGAVVGEVAALLDALERARAEVADDPDAGAIAAAELVDEKIEIARRALAAAAGVAVDAWSDRPTVAPGEPLEIEAVVWNGAAPGGPEGSGATPGTFVVAEEVTLAASGDWRIEPSGEADETDDGGRWGEEAPVPAGEPLPAGRLSRFRFTAQPAADAPPTVPYFLRRPLDGDLYDWSGAPAAVRGEPFGPPPLVARFELSVGGRRILLEREVVHREGDQAVGEVRRPIAVVPRLEVVLADDLVVLATGDTEPVPVPVTLVSRASRPLAGTLGLEAPPLWAVAEPEPFEIAPGETLERSLAIVPPVGLTPGRYPFRAIAELENGETHDGTVATVEYPHVRPTPYPRPATLELAAADLALPSLDAVAYVRGASDRVPEALARIGLPIEPVAGADLLAGDLSRYDAIVVGSRAYETDPDLAAATPRLLDYARAGGLVVVQYQQYQYARGGFAPYPLDISRPHDRVTDETAPVTPLVPDHPVFTTPNRIGPADWQGWVQERGLYFAGTWAPEYRPLLALPRDPALEKGDGDGDLRGALLVAPLGEGTYVYTGLAFFRQLPAGVPGAYRLFANLLALGADRG